MNTQRGHTFEQSNIQRRSRVVRRGEYAPEAQQNNSPYGRQKEQIRRKRMAKSLFIAEKPSVAQEFAKALKEKMSRGDGFLESDSYVVTWCVGHLVTMSYPEVYDPKYKRWSLATLPFLPETFLYEVIPGVKKQFQIVSRLLNRKDVSCIYVCTDSGREGE